MQPAILDLSLVPPPPPCHSPPSPHSFLPPRDTPLLLRTVRSSLPSTSGRFGSPRQSLAVVDQQLHGPGTVDMSFPSLQEKMRVPLHVGQCVLLVKSLFKCFKVSMVPVASGATSAIVSMFNSAVVASICETKEFPIHHGARLFLLLCRLWKSNCLSPWKGNCLRSVMSRPYLIFSKDRDMFDAQCYAQSQRQRKTSTPITDGS